MAASPTLEMTAPRIAVGRIVARHSLAWLVAANLVGIWLAAILLWPSAGNALAPLSFGRWMPLHHNWQLYGWCALPLVAALLHGFLDFRHPRVTAHTRVALGGWSLALLLGGVSWLGGRSSGKLYVEWSGWARWPLPIAMILLWAILAAHTWWLRDNLRRPVLLLRTAVLGALALVPPVMFAASAREYYPPINPDSGGATGAALLGSTLAIITLYAGLPHLLERPRLAGRRWFWTALGLSWVVYALLDRGATSHHRPAQSAGLGLLLAWVPALAWYWRGFQWTAGARGWLGASFVWWCLLVVSGWISFLPGWSEQLKFTNGLVAHAHLAMAGLVTSVNGVILQSLAGRLDRRWSFWCWQLGCAAHVGATLAVGWTELGDPNGLFWSEPGTQALYAVRFAAGIAMGGAAVQWFVAHLRR